MAANLVIDPDAELDIADAYGWYERQQRDGLGDEFPACVEAAIESVCRAPKVHQIRYRSSRRAQVRRFPYVVIHKYDEVTDTVFVAVVIHTARDPKIRQDRVDDE